MLSTQLRNRCLEVLHARSVPEFKRINVEFVQAMGFHTVAATVITDHSPWLTQFQSITNAPAAYLPSFEDMESAKLDPVSQHCKRSSAPIVWDQALYAARGRGDYWENQAAYGYLSGISIGIHLPRGRHFLFGVDSDRRVCADKRDMQNVLFDLHAFAAHSQAAAFDFCLPYSHAAASVGAPPLLPGELEALRRCMDGMNDWEVGTAIGISETEVLLRMRRVMQKLGCATRYEAALQAIRRGLVTCD